MRGHEQTLGEAQCRRRVPVVSAGPAGGFWEVRAAWKARAGLGAGVGTKASYEPRGLPRGRDGASLAGRV